MSTYEQAKPTGLSKPAILAFSESVAHQLGFSPGDEIEAVVSRLGGQIRFEDTLTEDPEMSGSLVIRGPKDFTIIVSAHTSWLRDRFTIAHELGHFFLHYMWRRHKGQKIEGPMVALRKGSDRVEWEANWFAGAFLMPQAAFIKKFSESKGDVAEVAKTFLVSPSAASVRAKQLGIESGV